MGTASPTAMEGCGCDLANALRANWGAKVDPMPEIGAAVDLPNLLLRGLATSPQTSRSVVGTTTAAPCGPTPSVSLLLVGVRSRCHQRAARFMACSEECVSSESGRIADPKPVDRADGGLASGVLVRRTGLRGIRGCQSPSQVMVSRVGGGVWRCRRRRRFLQRVGVPALFRATGLIVTPDRECLGHFPGASFPPAGIVELPCGRAPSGTLLPVMASRPGKGPTPATPPTGNMPAIAAALQTAPRPGPWRQPRPPGRGPSGVGSSQGVPGWSARLRPGLP